MDRSHCGWDIVVLSFGEWGSSPLFGSPPVPICAKLAAGKRPAFATRRPGTVSTNLR